MPIVMFRRAAGGDRSLLKLLLGPPGIALRNWKALVLRYIRLSFVMLFWLYALALGSRLCAVR